MKVNSYCLDCQDRHQGCHGTCERYKEFRQRLDEEREAKATSEEYVCTCYKNDKYRRESIGKQI